MHRIGEHAVVVGGSFAGVLAARALTEAYDRVTVIDRDVLHDDGGARRAVPQGLHAHALLPLGQRCLEQLLPGSVAELVAGGAASCAALEDYRFVLAGSPLARVNTGNRAVFASRPFIEAHVRARVRALPRVELRDRCDVVGLVAEGPRVTGVRVLRRQAESTEETLAADLVVAAGGRGARVPAWLEHLGFERPEEERLTVDVAYASRFVRLPEDGLGDARMALFTATPEWPRALYVFPQEGGRHIVSLGGYGAAHRPPADPDAFTAFALSVAPPDLHSSIAGAEPLSDVAVHAFPASVRRRYDRLARFPDGLLVCGDAIASFNPTYGQGLSVAAAEAVALRDCLAGGERRLARRFFAATARGPLRNAWDISTGSDLALPQVPGPVPVRVRLLNRYLRRLRAAAEHDHAVSGALIAVTGLLEEPRTLLAPGIVRRVARGPRAAAAAPPSRSRPLRVGAVTTPLREAGPEDATEAVVFVHGNPGSGADFEPLLTTVGAHGRRAVAWDAPGFGRAAGGFPQTVEAHAAFVGDALAALGIERAHLVLHDFGGPWGLRWAAGDPERFASAVLVNTGALPGYRWHALARVWRAPLLGELFMATTTRPGFRVLMRRGQRTRLPTAFVDRMYDDFDRATRRAVLALYRSVDDVGQRGRELAAALAPLDRPALVLWGADDPYLGVQQAARQRLAFPHADVRVLEGAGHWPFVDRPADVAAALLEHLDREWRRGESNPQLSLAKAVCSR